MKKNNKIIALHKKKIKILKKHNKLYYLEDRSIISDSDYDQLKSELNTLENKYTFLKKK